MRDFFGEKFEKFLNLEKLENVMKEKNILKKQHFRPLNGIFNKIEGGKQTDDNGPSCY